SNMKCSNSIAAQYECAVHQKQVDHAAVNETNRELHFLLYRASGMPMLVNMIANIWTQIAPVFALSMSVKERTIDDWESFRHHKRLIEALTDKDPDAARNAVVEDIRDAAEFIERSTWLGEQEG